MRTTISLIVITLLITILPAAAWAQRERRRQFVEDLLKTLIESQVDKDSDRVQPVVPGNIPVSPKVRAARAELQHLSQSFGQLVAALGSESAGSPAFRPLLGEAMHIKASADALHRASPRFSDLNQIARGYAPIDQAWRGLSHRMKYTRGISRGCLSIVDEINSHDAELCSILGLQPQLDRSELIRLASTLRADFRHLLQDINYDMAGQPAQRSLLVEGSQLMTLIQQSTSLIDRGDYSSIVAAFQQGLAGWRAYASKLRSIDSERIRRNVMRIEQTGRDIHAALWLPVQLDTEYLNHIVGSVERDVDRVLTLITLKDMLACEHPARLLNAARELQSSCGSFGQTIQRAQVIEDLIWDYRVFDVAWQELVNECRPITNINVRRRLDAASESMALLDQVLGGGPQIGRAQIVQMCSQLDELCRQLTVMVNSRIVPNNRYDSTFRRDLQSQTFELQRTTRQLHLYLVNGSDEAMIQKELGAAINYWERVRPLMYQCNEADKRSFTKLRTQMEPLFVKMQIAYAD